jgi:hypothetical protein
MGTEGSIAAGACSGPLVPRLIMRGTVPPLPTSLQGVHANNFTLPFLLSHMLYTRTCSNYRIISKGRRDIVFEHAGVSEIGFSVEYSPILGLSIIPVKNINPQTCLLFCYYYWKSCPSKAMAECHKRCFADRHNTTNDITSMF